MEKSTIAQFSLVFTDWNFEFSEENNIAGSVIQLNEKHEKKRDSFNKIWNSEFHPAV